MNPHFESPIDIQGFVKKCNADELCLTMKKARVLLVETGFSKGTEGRFYQNYHATALALFTGMAIDSPEDRECLLSASGAAFLYELLQKRRRRGLVRV